MRRFVATCYWRSTTSRGFMAKYLENCKYIVLIAVFALMVAAAATFLWGGAKTINFLLILFNNNSDESLITLYLLEVVDTFLIGTVLIYLFDWAV
jgi:uncharacterized membrane protein YqhA